MIMLSSGLGEYSQSPGMKSCHISKDSDGMNIQPLSPGAPPTIYMEKYEMLCQEKRNTQREDFSPLCVFMCILSNTLVAHFKGFRHNEYPTKFLLLLLQSTRVNKILFHMMLKVHIEYFFDALVSLDVKLSQTK